MEQKRLRMFVMRASLPCSQIEAHPTHFETGDKTLNIIVEFSLLCFKMKYSSALSLRRNLCFEGICSEGINLLRRNLLRRRREAWSIVMEWFFRAVCSYALSLRKICAPKELICSEGSCLKVWPSTAIEAWSIGSSSFFRDIQQ